MLTLTAAFYCSIRLTRLNPFLGKIVEICQLNFHRLYLPTFMMVLRVATNPIYTNIYLQEKLEKVRNKKVERKCYLAILNLDSERFKVVWWCSKFWTLGKFQNVWMFWILANYLPYLRSKSLSYCIFMVAWAQHATLTFGLQSEIMPLIRRKMVESYPHLVYYQRDYISQILGLFQLRKFINSLLCHSTPKQCKFFYQDQDISSIK